LYIVLMIFTCDKGNNKITELRTILQRSGRFGTLKSDSTHHFFRNACTKSGSLRFSQFSGCWLILSVYILMSFDFPIVRWNINFLRDRITSTHTDHKHQGWTPKVSAVHPAPYVGSVDTQGNGQSPVNLLNEIKLR
jgi:hypothetical protein